MTTSRLKQLIELYQQGPLSESEWKEFIHAMADKQFVDELQKETDQIFLSNPADILWDAGIDAEIRMGIPELNEKNSTIRPVHRVHFLKTAWFKYAAASILIILSILLIRVLV